MPVRNAVGKVVGLTAAEVGDALLAATARALVAIAVEFKANVVEATPKLTNWAAANWRLNVGAPAVGTVGTRPTTKTKKGAPTRFTGGGDGGLAAVLRYQVGDGPIYGTNNAPYIRALNAGSSKKAPAAFVEAALERAIATGEATFGEPINITALRSR